MTAPAMTTVMKPAPRHSSSATTVNTQTARTEAGGVAIRTGAVVTVKSRLAPGTAFARYAQALAISKGNLPWICPGHTCRV